jgi:hypothetical protein
MAGEALNSVISSWYALAGWSDGMTTLSTSTFASASCCPLPVRR